MEIISEFNPKESLLRAVYPPNIKPQYWNNGKITSAVFKDKNGVSVDRTYNRSMEESIEFIRKNLKGYIFSVDVRDCIDVKVHVIHSPANDNFYHSEIHGSEDEVLLDEIQALILARKAVVRYNPIANITYIY